MIQRFLDEEKEQGGIGSDVSTTESADLIMSGILGACVMYTSDKSRKRLDSTIAALISYLNKLDTKQ